MHRIVPQVNAATETAAKATTPTSGVSISSTGSRATSPMAPFNHRKTPSTEHIRILKNFSDLKATYDDDNCGGFTEDSNGQSNVMAISSTTNTNSNNTTNTSGSNNNNVTNATKIQRYSRSALYLLRNEDCSRRRPDCATRIELQALGFWKYRNGSGSRVGSSNGNVNSNIVIGLGSHQPTNSAGNAIDICGGGGGGGGVGSGGGGGSSGANQSQHNIFRRMNTNSNKRGDSSAGIGNVDVGHSSSMNSQHNQQKMHTPPQQQSHQATSLQKTTNLIDHRSISSAHLMPAFAKRRIGLGVSTTTIISSNTTNNNNNNTSSSSNASNSNQNIANLSSGRSNSICSSPAPDCVHPETSNANSNNGNNDYNSTTGTATTTNTNRQTARNSIDYLKKSDCSRDETPESNDGGNRERVEYRAHNEREHHLCGGSGSSNNITNARNNRIGSGRLLPRDVSNWDYHHDQHHVSGGSGTLEQQETNKSPGRSDSDSNVLSTNRRLYMNSVDREGREFFDAYERRNGASSGTGNHELTDRDNGSSSSNNTNNNNNNNSNNNSNHHDNRNTNVNHNQPIGRQRRNQTYLSHNQHQHHSHHNTHHNSHHNSSQQQTHHSHHNQHYHHGTYSDRHAEEPEWFSGGPTSQDDTIELRGFDEEIHDYYSLNPKRNNNSVRNNKNANSNITTMQTGSDPNKMNDVTSAEKEDTSLDESQESNSNEPKKSLDNQQSFDEMQKNENDKNAANVNNKLAEENTRSVSDSLASGSGGIIIDVSELELPVNSLNQFLKPLPQNKAKTNENVQMTTAEAATPTSTANTFFLDDFFNAETPLELQTDLSDNQASLMSTSRFSRWFGNSHKTEKPLSEPLNAAELEKAQKAQIAHEQQQSQSGKNMLLEFLQRSKLPAPLMADNMNLTHAIPSVEELEAKMRKMDTKSVQLHNNDMEHALKMRQHGAATNVDSQDVEAFKKLLAQLGDNATTAAAITALHNNNANNNNKMPTQSIPSFTDLHSQQQQQQQHQHQLEMFLQQQQPSAQLPPAHCFTSNSIHFPHNLEAHLPALDASPTLAAQMMKHNELKRQQLLQQQQHQQHQKQKQLFSNTLEQQQHEIAQLTTSSNQSPLINPSMAGVAPSTTTITDPLSPHDEITAPASSPAANIGIGGGGAVAATAIPSPAVAVQRQMHSQVPTFFAAHLQNLPQKRLEAFHLFQGVMRGEIAISGLEQELNNPNVTQPIRDIIATVLCEIQRAQFHQQQHFQQQQQQHLQQQQQQQQHLQQTHVQQHSPIPHLLLPNTLLLSPADQQQQQQQQQQQRSPSLVPQASTTNGLMGLIGTRDLQMHTQVIMQNMLLKKKLEGQQQHEQHQQDILHLRQDTKQQHQLNASDIETNDIMTAQHQQQSVRNSPTPLAFTPTSVLRKMTAEKDANIQQQQQKHPYMQQTQANAVGGGSGGGGAVAITATQPRMILGGSNAIQQQQQLRQQQQQQLHCNNIAVTQQQQNNALAIGNAVGIVGGAPNAQQLKWPTIGNSNNLLHSNIKPIGRPILKGPLNIMPLQQQQPPQPRQLQPPNQQLTYGGKLELQQLQQHQQLQKTQHMLNQQQQQQVSPTPAVTQISQSLQQQNFQQQQPQRAISLLRQQQQQQQQQHQQRNGGLSPTSNQLAQWFSPELLAQASAGKLPLLNMNQTLSLEEFERSIQHSSTTTVVHN